MGFHKKTIKEVDLDGKRVLLRADYNVPDVKSDFRIKQSLPTIEYILERNARGLVIISHSGRPKDHYDKHLSLRPVAEHLKSLLGRRVRFAEDCIGDEAKAAAAELKEGDILLLENLRFHAEEEKNDAEFAKALVETAGAEVFVQDGFGVVHRAHSSTDAINKLLPSAAGLLLEKEVETINNAMNNPEHPLVAVVGGAKIEDKIELLGKLIELADCVALGGAMANNFLKIEGYAIGDSLYERAGLGAARDILAKARAKEKKQAFSFILPVDAVVSKSMDGRSPTRIVDLASQSLADIMAYPKIPKPAAYSVAKNEGIYDIGPVSAARIAGVIQLTKTVIWNGTLGAAEVKGIAGAHAPFAHGSRITVEAMIGLSKGHAAKPYSLAGGGDTASYLEAEGLAEDFNFVSTGGGATLELMTGKKLPGVEALSDK